VLGANLVVNLGLIPPFGVVGAAIAVVLSELLGFAVVRHLYGQVGRAPWPSFDPRMLLAGLLMAAAMAPLLLLPGGFTGSLVAVAVGGALGGLVYAAALIALGAVPAAIVPYLPPRVLRFGRST
jgi:O-antigen/teichoic acid export membrane protein